MRTVSANRPKHVASAMLQESAPKRRCVPERRQSRTPPSRPDSSHRQYPPGKARRSRRSGHPQRHSGGSRRNLRRVARSTKALKIRLKCAKNHPGCAQKRPISFSFLTFCQVATGDFPRFHAPRSRHSRQMRIAPKPAPSALECDRLLPPEKFTPPFCRVLPSPGAQ